MCYYICPIGGCKNDDYETMLTHIEEKPGGQLRLTKTIY